MGLWDFGTRNRQWGARFSRKCGEAQIGLLLFLPLGERGEDLIFFHSGESEVKFSFITEHFLCQLLVGIVEDSKLFPQIDVFHSLFYEEPS